MNINLSKTMSYALRHAPWEFELELDSQGFVEIVQLLESLKEERRWKNITVEDIAKVVDNCDKNRFEIVDNKIRARYGHSIGSKINRENVSPPTILYHGTPKDAAESILKTGLKPRGRQYVHLSVDTEMADSVGKRRANKPVILVIDAKKAFEEGLAFYKGNERVWLADYVDYKYIREM